MNASKSPFCCCGCTAGLVGGDTGLAIGFDVGFAAAGFVVVPFGAVA